MNTEKANIQNSMDVAEIPEYVFESLARSLLPVIQKYYNSEGGKSNGKQRRRFQTVHLHKESGRIAMIGSPPAFFVTSLQFPQQKQQIRTHDQSVQGSDYIVLAPFIGFDTIWRKSEGGQSLPPLY